MTEFEQPTTKQKMETPTPMDIVHTSSFADVDNNVVVEIASWLIAPIEPGESPTLQMVRDLIRFSRTCKRISEVINHPPLSGLIWRTVDFGSIINEKSGRYCEKPGCFVEQTVFQTRIESCEKLSRIRGIPNSHTLALILSMPNLTDLSVELGESSTCPTSLMGAIPRKERAKFGECIRGVEIERAIESLPRLTKLFLRGAFLGTLELDSIRIPRTLENLEIVNLDSALIFGKEVKPIESIKVLSLNLAGENTRAVSVCPAITSLSLTCKEVSREEMAKIWRTCTHLQNISIGTWKSSSLALDEFEKSKCCNLITELKLNVDTTEGAWETMIGRCPHIVELGMWNPEPTVTEIRGMATLKNLEVLEVVCRSDDSGLSKAFSELGESDGTPFKRIALRNARMELGGFFSTRRCHQLREISFMDCSMSEGSIEALAENVRDSLVSLEFIGGDDEFIVPLLARCSRIDRLLIHSDSTRLMKRIGEESKSPLGFLKIWSLTDKGIRGIAPALNRVVHLQIDSGFATTECMLWMVSKCPQLRQLTVQSGLIETLRDKLPSNIILRHW
jgi:hypothetical protein